MASLDEFFNRAIKIAQDVRKARVQRKGKQQEIDNLATFSELNTQDRRTRTGEARQRSDADLGQQTVDLERASLKVRKQLGLGQLKIGGRQAAVQEGGLGLRRSRQEETSALFKRLFPDVDNDGGSGDSGFRGRSDQGVLNSARTLAGGGPGVNRSSLDSTKVQEVISQSRRRTGLKSTLEQDLLSLR